MHQTSLVQVTGPPKVMLDEFFCLKTARVAHSGVIMESVKEVMLCSWRDISMIFVV